MTFEKAMRLLLKGKRLCVPGWDKDSYIRLADSEDAGVGIVTKEGNTYEIYAADYLPIGKYSRMAIRLVTY